MTNKKSVVENGKRTIKDMTLQEIEHRKNLHLIPTVLKSDLIEMVESSVSIDDLKNVLMILVNQ